MKVAVRDIYPCDPTEEQIRDDTGFNDEASCAECHRKATWGAVIQHTPSQTAGYSDEEIIMIFTMAKKPVGWKQHITDLRPYWMKFHKWKMSPAQARGLISYLRALEPTAMEDFMDQTNEPPPEELDGSFEPSDNYRCLEADGGIRTVDTVPPSEEELDAGL
jgi:hypothetical protein